MKKGIILIGPDKSGKSHMANQISSLLKEGEISSFTARYKLYIEKLTTFGNVTEKTKLIIIDDVRKISTVAEIFPLITNGFEVNNKMKPAFHTNPMFLIICDSTITINDLSGLTKSFAETFNVFSSETLNL
jgi:hypothetical protein